MTQGVVNLFNQLAQNDFGFFQKIRSLEDIMTHGVKSLGLDDTYEVVVDFFRKNGFHHAPVIEEGDVVGIISDRDVLRHRPPKLGSAAEEDNDHLALRTPASQFMTRATIALPANSSPIRALSLMLDNHVDSVLVHDGNKQVVGIMTPRDFMKMVLLFHRVCTGRPSLVRFRLVDLDLTRGIPLDMIFSRGARSVRDVMTKDVKCLAETDTVATAIELMQTLEVRHLPVIDESQGLIGMVSDREVLRCLPLPAPRLEFNVSQHFRAPLFAVDDDRVLGQPVTSVMNRNPTTTNSDCLFVDAIGFLLEQTISGLPVVDAESKVVGMFTTTDVLRVLRIVLQMRLRPRWHFPK